MREGAPGRVEFVDLGSGRIQVRGVLTFATARYARAEGSRLFAANADRALEVDLSAVSSSDSAGLAVLLDWLVLTSRQGQALRFAGVPAPIRTVAQISDVEVFLNQGLTV